MSAGYNQENKMNPIDFTALSEDYQRIAQAIAYIQTHADEQPTLEEIAASVNLSEYHFQRLFSRWAGISPKRFLQFLTKENAKRLLDEQSVLDAAYTAGLSSPGRLHDLFVQAEAVTPGEYRSKGAGLEIAYGFHATPFGECLLAVTPRGICFLAFVDGNDRGAALQELARDWQQAALTLDPARTEPYVARIFSPTPQPPLPLHLRGTNFQMKVWEALLRIPAGSTTTYEDLAERIGQPRAARAVGGALAHNPVAYLIPCHRVLRKSGDFGGYRYRPERKKAMLLRESALEPVAA
jgi:AraC family transcriptional regulator, regulatory protein of adaptative response / methylated-DNA-[protein]-cysteine methyltransferase